MARDLERRLEERFEHDPDQVDGDLSVEEIQPRNEDRIEWIYEVDFDNDVFHS